MKDDKPSPDGGPHAFSDGPIPVLELGRYYARPDSGWSKWKIIMYWDHDGGLSSHSYIGFQTREEAQARADEINNALRTKGEA